jgi:hypothetical protein
MPNDPLIGQVENENEVLYSSICRLYTNMKNFMRVFLTSKHPNTICWMLEILHIVTDKFRAEDPILHKKLKVKLHEPFDSLMKSAIGIVTDSFGVKYSEDYGISKLTYSPTVYEMMKRYEFVRRRQEVKKPESVI